VSDKTLLKRSRISKQVLV